MFKVGDKVKLREDSRYFCDRGKHQIFGVGVIEKDELDEEDPIVYYDHRYTVYWRYNNLVCSNCYRDIDLEFAKPLTKEEALGDV